MPCPKCGVILPKPIENENNFHCTSCRDELAKAVDWSKLHCKNHSEKQAVVWINFPVGNQFCNECYQDLQRWAIRTGTWRVST
jgi:hypothetical protein